MAVEPYIRLQGVGKRYETKDGPVEACTDIDLDIRPNEFVTFVGASGCGKSTLLRTIGGLETHSSGELLVDGRPVNGPGIDRAMVFQHYSLYPWMTVLENIRFCRQLQAHTRHRTSADVEAASGRSDALLRLNSPDWLRANARAYFRIGLYGTPDDPIGANWDMLWYGRNLAIFNNIVRATKPGDRVLVIYGAGHGNWLRQLATDSGMYRVEDTARWLRE